MPIVHIGTKLIYFAHVPRCGGSAVEDYLIERFGTVGFLDRAYRSIHEEQVWSWTSPQHIHADALERLIPASFFAARFAVVRHPVDRLISVFCFQRDIHRDIPAETDFGDWIAGLPDIWKSNPFYLDNHVRPMSEIVPRDTTVFRLEDGLDRIVAWLDVLEGSDNGQRHVQKTNSYEQRIENPNLVRGPVPRVTDHTRHQIRDYFTADFERFGYDGVAG